MGVLGFNERNGGNRRQKMKIRADSTEFFIADWTRTSEDPRSHLVEFAFVVPGTDPVSGDWKSGSWEPTGALPYSARILVGARGGLSLAAGTYQAYCRITTGTEQPVRNVGILTVE